MTVPGKNASSAIGHAFPSTRWSRLIHPQGEKGRRSAWESLAAAYWKPVYGYVRLRWARTDGDARDCTQEFFLWMMEGDFLAHADPGRGRFRSFVKVALKNFLADLERKRRTLKRGGERTLVSIHGDGDETPALDLPDLASKAPDDVLDELWRAELLERAVAALEEELAYQGKKIVFAVFRDYFLETSELDYAALARRHDISASDVSNHLQLAKKRYRAQLKNAVSDTVGNRADLEAELSWLLGRGEA